MPTSRICLSHLLAITVFAATLSLEHQASAEAPPSSAAPAEAEATTPNYVAALAGTTLAYRAPRTTMVGPQGDLSPALGYGRLITKTVALELDAGPLFTAGRYAGFVLEPGVVWAFLENVYTAARFLVPVAPKVAFAVAPGIGVTYTFKSGIAPFFEANAISFLGHGTPDFGIGGSVGASYAF